MKKVPDNIDQNLGADSSELRSIILAVLATALLSTIILGAMDINRSFMVVLGGILTVSLFVTFLGYIKIGSWSTLLSSLAVLSLLVFENNGIRDIAVMGLIVVLIGAGLLAGKTGTIVIGSIIILEIGVYGALETQGWVSNKFNIHNYFSDYLALCIAVGMVTVLQWLVISRLNNTILNAKKELNERKRVQSKLQEAEARYRGLVERIPLVLYTSEPGHSGEWHFVSPQITALTGYSPQDWIDNQNLWFSRIHPDDRERIVDEEAQALEQGRMPKLEYRLLTKEDKLIWVYDESLVIVDTDRLLVQGFLLDITARKLAEEQLTKRLAELQAVHGISETLIQKSDLKNLIFETGEQIRHAFKANNVMIALHDPSTNLIHFPYDYEDDIPRKDVPLRYGEGMTTRIMESRQPLSIPSNWEEKAAELSVIKTNKMPILSSFSAPIMTTENVIGVITLESTEREFAFSDIDTRPILSIAANLAVAIEKTRLQDSLRQELEIQERLIRELEGKNEELERFAYTASHDLKSPLITIRGFLGYLESDARAGNFDRMNSDIARISEATEKMNRLLSELLELSRVGRVANEKQDVPFEIIVAEALQRVDGQLKAKSVEVKIGENFPTVHVDRERIIEVVQNLVDNAVKFMGSQQHPLIEINFMTQDGFPIFYIRDNGIGIKTEFHKRIFGLFDKLNNDTEGTGIGLALVKRIVEVHGGAIWVDSTVGSGSTFYFTLGSDN
ncbi:MAG: PAS domain-containing protein [Anaerolineales bacterium]|nr:PAS domain-containing protein [Anaerolineales bacterium]